MLCSQLGASSSNEDIFFDFRKQRFIYSKDTHTFSKLPYPTKQHFGFYLKTTGHGTDAKVAIATDKWGRNVWVILLNSYSYSSSSSFLLTATYNSFVWWIRFDYPQPTFQKLMKEHCMEPFFVFQVRSCSTYLLVLNVHHSYLILLLYLQVFCVGLWCLDEYWYYSLFTLFMLFMFESTMAKSRLKTLTELRRVRVDSQTLMVYRSGKYVCYPTTLTNTSAMLILLFLKTSSFLILSNA